MGKIADGLDGALSGKVGNHVYYNMFGETRVRMKPSKRTGKKTKKEKSNTGGFAKVQAFMKPLSEYLRIGYKDFGTKTGGYKGAVSYALNHAVEGDHTHRYVNPEKVRVCGGELHFPESVDMVLEADHFLRFNWSTEIGGNGHGQDQVFMLAYSPAEDKGNNGKHVCQPTGAFRVNGTDGLQLKPKKNEIEYHVYLGFIARDRSSQAHSVYLGKVTIPAKLG